jgi:adenylate cyclase
LNLLHRNWLTRLPFVIEFGLIILGGILFGAGLARIVSPFRLTLAAFLAAALLLALAWLLFTYWLVWFAWLIVAVQIGVAWGYSITFNALENYLQRRLLADSLARHVSPARVRQILENPNIIEPGVAHQHEISIIFSDIADFSKLSEKTSSQELFQILNDYYEAALACVFQHDGTVMMLIGDAIYAIWNAPYAQTDHKARACHAALDMQHFVAKFRAERAGVVLRTRIGLHCGVANVGNLGSSTKIEYTAIGESVNLASRLEGLNKYLGTSVLITSEIHAAITGQLITRYVGQFIFKGFSKPAQVYELIGKGLEDEQRSLPWREAFARGLVAFSGRAFDEAEPLFKQAIQKRMETEPPNSPSAGQQDGPSRFYLEKIAQFRKNPPSSGWQGEIEMEGK